MTNTTETTTHGSAGRVTMNGKPTESPHICLCGRTFTTPRGRGNHIAAAARRAAKDAKVRFAASVAALEESVAVSAPAGDAGYEEYDDDHGPISAVSASEVWAAQVLAALSHFASLPEGTQRYWVTLAYVSESLDASAARIITKLTGHPVAWEASLGDWPAWSVSSAELRGDFSGAWAQ